VKDTGQPIAIPRILGISWWGLFLAFVLNIVLSCYVDLHFHSHTLASINILYVWIYVQAIWLKRAEPESKAIYWYVASDVFRIATAISQIALPQVLSNHEILLSLVELTTFALSFYAIFKFKWEMEYHFNKTDPTFLKLGGVMTFFFNVFYFQYYFHEIYRYKQQEPLSITPAEV
jgi:hypothetical protein